MRRWLLLVLLSLGGISNADAEQIIRWTTIAPLTETVRVAPGFEILQSSWIPEGQIWTLQSGLLQYPAAMVCHLWENDAAGVPIHVPYMMWGNSANYLIVPPMIVRGPTMFYFWCWSDQPHDLFYSLEWMVSP